MVIRHLSERVISRDPSISRPYVIEIVANRYLNGFCRPLNLKHIDGVTYVREQKRAVEFAGTQVCSKRFARAKQSLIAVDSLKSAVRDPLLRAVQPRVPRSIARTLNSIFSELSC